MLRVSNLMLQIRGRLHDMAKTTFSDWEITEGINRAAALLFATFSSRGVNIGAKSTTVTIVNGSSSIPEDFLSIKDIRQKYSLIPGEYRIIGDNIEAEDGEYILDYYFTPPKIFSEVDTLDMPRSLELAVVNISAEAIKGDEDRAIAIANIVAVQQAGREISRYAKIGPVEIWGGK